MEGSVVLIKVFKTCVPSLNLILVICLKLRCHLNWVIRYLYTVQWFTRHFIEECS
jgi:hypothetical protein